MLRIITTLGAIAVASTALAGGDAERGEYLVLIMSCGDCHSGRTPDGALDPDQFLTGGTVGFEIPGLGTFWPPNLTPSPEGLGGWSDEEVITAVRTGERPDGRQLAPAMPYHFYKVLTDGDAADLVAYLRTLPPSPNEVPEPLAPEAPAPLPFYRVMPPS